MENYNKIINAYDRFVPFGLLKLLGKNDISEIRLGDQVEKRISILFTDIRDFTTISESMTPQENFNFLNSYLSRMEPHIKANDGVIDKYIGDAIMAIFPNGADDALQCSLDMLRELRVYNKGRQRAKYHPVKIGIGLNTGLAMIGAVGGYNRMEATVISDAVNLCSRIESLTKVYKTELLISESTYNDVNSERKKFIRFIDRVLVKGKLKPQSIYEVFEMDADTNRKLKSESKKIFEEALANYHYGNVETAKKMLEKHIAANPNDEPAQIYLDRCRRYSSTGYHESSSELHDRISWNEQFIIGHTQIDRQHHDLVDLSLSLIEKVEQGAVTQDIIRLTSELAQKAKIHFKTEESVMEKADYPLLEQQKQQHEIFITAFPRLVNEISDTSISRIFKMFKIQIFLIDWLVNHTLKDDRSFGKYLRYSQL